jgi:hypothetical protein
MSNPLARNGEPRHRRCEPQAPRSLLIGRDPAVVVNLADRVEPVVALRDAGSGLGRAGCRGPGSERIRHQRYRSYSLVDQRASASSNRPMVVANRPR